MANVYDVCDLIFISNENQIECNWVCEIMDYDDFIEIKTDVAIEQIGRGWIGDIVFNFNGFDVNDYTNEYNAHTQFVLKNVLCSACKFERDDQRVVTWTYRFLKY